MEPIFSELEETPLISSVSGLLYKRDRKCIKEIATSTTHKTPLIHVLDQDVSGFLNVVLMFLNKGANIEACFIRLSVVKAKEVLQVSL